MLQTTRYGFSDARHFCCRLKRQTTGNSDPPICLEPAVVLWLVHPFGRQRHFRRFSSAPDRQVQRRTVAAFDRGFELVKGVDGCAADCHDDVALFNAGAHCSALRAQPVDKRREHVRSFDLNHATVPTHLVVQRWFVGQFVNKCAVIVLILSARQRPAIDAQYLVSCAQPIRLYRKRTHVANGQWVLRHPRRQHHKREHDDGQNEVKNRTRCYCRRARPQWCAVHRGTQALGIILNRRHGLGILAGRGISVSGEFHVAAKGQSGELPACAALIYAGIQDRAKPD